MASVERNRGALAAAAACLDEALALDPSHKLARNGITATIEDCRRHGRIRSKLIHGCRWAQLHTRRRPDTGRTEKYMWEAVVLELIRQVIDFEF